MNRRLSTIVLLAAGGPIAAGACGTSSTGAPVLGSNPNASSSGMSGASSSSGGHPGGSSSGSGTSSGSVIEGGCSAGSAASGGCVTEGGSSSEGGSNASCGVGLIVSSPTSNGHPVLPPRWAFGVLWGSYYDQAGVYKPSSGDDSHLLVAATRLRTEGYGGDLQWIDSSWLFSQYSGASAAPYYLDFAFDGTAFPDPKAMIATLRDNHFHFGVWEWPWIDHQVSQAATWAAMGYFTGAVGGGWHGDPMPYQVAFTQAAAKAWWIQMNQGVADMGLDFMKLDTEAGSGTTYATQYHDAAYQVTQHYPAANDPEAKKNGARGFIIAHGDNNTAPGNDQLPGMWTGDTDAVGASPYTGFQKDVSRAKALNTTVTAAYWGGDTGGYNNVPSDDEYIRWLEYSTFTPLQEFFGAKAPGIGARFPWLFGKKIAQLPAIAKLYNQLRYRLLPFRYSNAQAAYQVTPLAYPVVWQGDAIVLQGDGDSQILTQPVTTQTTTATVALPAGTWVQVAPAADAGFAATGMTYAGSATVQVPIEQGPIFVKAGSILPLGPVIQWVDQLPSDPLTLDIYPAVPAGVTRYTLYEDDGISLGYMGGAFATTAFTADNSGGKTLVSIGAQKLAMVDFAGRLCSRTYVLKLNQQAAAPSSVTRDASVVAMSSAAAFGAATEGWYFDPPSKTTWIKFRLDSSLATSVTVQ
jgi:alpha-glucosidase